MDAPVLDLHATYNWTRLCPLSLPPHQRPGYECRAAPSYSQAGTSHISQKPLTVPSRLGISSYECLNLPSARAFPQDILRREVSFSLLHHCSAFQSRSRLSQCTYWPRPTKFFRTDPCRANRICISLYSPTSTPESRRPPTRANPAGQWDTSSDTVRRATDEN